jgi:hypothetical protein
MAVDLLDGGLPRSGIASRRRILTGIVHQFTLAVYDGLPQRSSLAPSEVFLPIRRPCPPRRPDRRPSVEHTSV